MRLVALFLVAAAGASAQQGEIGFAAGYGSYHNGSVIAPGGTAKAGIRSRFTLGVVVCEDLYQHVGGELRWTYQDGDPFLSAGGVKSNIQGQSHAFNYDLLFYGRPPEAKLRPYVAVGGGLKWYRITGPTPPSQPLSGIAALTGDDALTVLGSLGAGIKYYVSRRMVLRFDFRDFVTPFPKAAIKPVPGATGRGLLHQFTPMIGISYAIR